MQRKLGEGGMGEVYLAWDESLGRSVALKLIRPSRLDDHKSQQRFRREARTAAALSHPAIVQTFRVIESHPDGAESVDCLVMEHVAGCSLRELLAHDRLPLEVALRIFRQVAEGLAYAHGRGVVHRDLKAENVMLTPDLRVKILDFGLAKRLAAGESSTTGGGGLVGTLYSMAPEQAAGKSVDHRADLFSLGVLGYELFSGERPFVGETAHQVWINVMHNPHRPILDLVPTLPPEVAGLIEKLLEKNPDDRLQQASLVVEALDPGSLSGTSISFPRGSRFEDLPPAVRTRLAEASTLDTSLPTLVSPLPFVRRRTRPIRVAAALLVLLPLLGFGFFLAWPRPVDDEDLPTLAILPMAGENGAVCAALLGDFFRLTSGIALLRPGQVNEVATWLDLEPGRLPEPALRQKLVDSFSDYFVVGRCGREGEQLKVEAALYRGAAGEPLAAAAVTSADWVRAGREAHQQLAAALPQGVVLGELPAAMYPASAGARRAMIDGLAALESADSAKAAERFAAALVEEGNHPRLHFLHAWAAAEPGAAAEAAQLALTPPPPGASVAERRLHDWMAFEQGMSQPALVRASRLARLAAANPRDATLPLLVATPLKDDGQLQLAKMWLASWPRRPPLIRARHQIGYSQVARELTQYPEAAATAQDALALDLPPKQRARALFQAGTALDELGQDPEKLLREAKLLFDQVGSHKEAMEALETIGLSLVERRRPQEAQAALEEILAYYQQNRDLEAMGRLQTDVATRSIEVGDFARAKELLAKAISAFQSRGSKAYLGLAYQARATMHHENLDFVAARQDYQRALALLEAAGMVDYQARVLANLGEAETQAGDLASAARHIDEAFRRAPAQQSPEISAYILMQRAELRRRQARLDEAAADLTAALKRAEQSLDFKWSDTYWLCRIRVAGLRLTERNLGIALELADGVVSGLNDLFVADSARAEHSLAIVFVKAKVQRWRALEAQGSPENLDKARRLRAELLGDPALERYPQLRQDRDELKAAR